MKYLLFNNTLASDGKLFNRCIENIWAVSTFHLKTFYMEAILIKMMLILNILHDF